MWMRLSDFVTWLSPDFEEEMAQETWIFHMGAFPNIFWIEVWEIIHSN